MYHHYYYYQCTNDINHTIVKMLIIVVENILLAKIIIILCKEKTLFLTKQVPKTVHVAWIMKHFRREFYSIERILFEFYSNNFDREFYRKVLKKIKL